MTFFFSILLLAAGFFILIKGAGILIDGATALARSWGMSDLMIGLTIVAFGTSMPELLVNVIASAQGNTAIALGNVIQSNIANILLVLGSASLIAPLYVRTSTVWKEIPLSILATVVLFILLNDVWIDRADQILLSRSDGLVLISFFLIFLYYTFGMRTETSEEHTKRQMPLWLAMGYVASGCILLPLGGKIVVESAINIATTLGVSEAFIGLSLVALGTSLPEVAAACMAAWRGKQDIAVGNVVGSNIFNILWILGVSGIIRPLTVKINMDFDMILVLASSILLLFLVHKGPIHKRILFWKHPRQEYLLMKNEGVVLLIAYVAYLVFIGIRG